MKNKAVMKMAKMAGDNRTAMKLKAEDAAMKMKKQAAMKMAKKDSAMNMGHKSSPKKHIVKVGNKKGVEAPNAEGAYTHNQAHRDKKFDMNHQQISSPKKMKKGSAMDMGHSPKKMKKNSPMKDNHFKTEKLKQVDLVGKKGRKKFYETTKHVGGGNVETFKHKKDGTVVRRDDISAGGRSGGGFSNRLKKEGLGSAIANIAPVRYFRTLKRELGGEYGKMLGLGHREQNPEHLKGKHKLTNKKKK